MKYTTKIKMTYRLADPAQIMFFGNILPIAHDIFEEFIQEAGFTWAEWFKPSEWACPIRRAEVDFKSPLYPGQEFEVDVIVGSLSESSFKMHYDFRQGERLCAQVMMIHTFVDAHTFQKRAIPTLVRDLLSKYTAN